MMPVNIKQLTKEYATRRKLSDFKSLMGILPDPNKILQQNNYDYEIFRDLLTDPHLSAAIQQRKMQILQMQIEIAGTSEQVKRGKKVLNRISTFKFINECLDALLYGFSAMEVIYEYDEFANELIITDVSEKPQEWFIFDQRNEIKLRKKDRGMYLFEAGVSLPDFKFIIIRNQPSYENPYGEKLLANVYWPVTFKCAAVEYWQDRVERYGLPFLEGEYPSTASDEDIKKFEERIEDMLESNILIKEEGYKLSFREPVKYDLGKIFEYIANFHNTEISKAILSETLTIQLDSSGSYKVADIHREMLRMLGTADKRLVELAINRLLQFDMFLNFGEVEAATVKLNEAKDETERGNIVEIVG
ncbi:hypothetical protein ASZ90_003392 [hydrocarbon metagenome]|uniref:DUF935 family protein n=1 Tax=hydrocarbon metagenome TaxID=938273 RepID=A0A0W8G0T3_9ZZZZ